MDETLIWPVAVTPRLINMQRLINTRQANSLTMELETVEWTTNAALVETPSSMAQAAADTGRLVFKVLVGDILGIAGGRSCGYCWAIKRRVV